MGWLAVVLLVEAILLISCRLHRHENERKHFSRSASPQANVVPNIELEILTKKFMDDILEVSRLLWLTKHKFLFKKITIMCNI